jgi:rod shape-determining protein MreC
VQRRRTVLILLVLISITLITIDSRGGNRGIGASIRNGARDILAPVQDAVDSAVSPISDWWDGVTKSGEIKATNRRLRRELQTARGRLDTARAALRENRELKALADLAFAPDLAGVDAQVVLGSPGNFEDTVGLDKGTDDGIAVDQPVVSGRGLLGRIARASGQRSTVLLLSDRDSGVNVRDARTGVLGVINGRPDSELQTLGNIEAAAEIQKGDLLVTVGSPDGPYAPGIPVARVVSVQQRAGDLFKRVSVRLLADPATTNFVRVLHWPAEPTEPAP